MKPTSAGRRPVSPDAETVTASGVGRELRRLRKAAGETQAETARIIGVTRANLTQWETGKYLPSTHNARQLDDHFRAANALFTLVETARSPQEHTPPAVGDAGVVDTSRSLLQVFHTVGARLAERLIRDEHGKPLGWRQNLQKKTPPTVLSTAYGISTMQLVGDTYLDLHPLVENLHSRRSEFGWRGRPEGRWPETTAAVVDALFRVGTTLSADDGLRLLEHSLDPFSNTRPYLLATTLQTAVRLRPDAPLTDRLIDDLLATRLEFDGLRLWPEKNEAGLVAPEPSVAHTARAIVVLRDVLRNRDDRNDVREAADEATQWLVDHTHPDDGVAEDLEKPRPDGDGTARIIIRHFTSAWVVQALATAPLLPLPRLNRALGTLWERYDADQGLWAWGSGDLPIWQTLDAVTALRSAALAVAAPPLSPPGTSGTTP
ncbi:helix-turn-helix domain-containing protein [Amycolatopsis keratiniphila]|uniref:helix-turn-helix domain-containing protein n=1 Tax=Amycolatopsis keratiniphila TaxID=129921 RepID=UPI000879EB50|nr:helix-turn-helix transcriptional regulator [Amycolatopsis keratiniphila]OLZ51218.1 XRE family transcriptional regulator [Amycolatopsis keratiniphila subsp. nogabecina]SDU30049.1 DNA-binding transcriptional regulator, XRE-family HTH domain [Amycolatopsis keratiniphila]